MHRRHLLATAPLLAVAGCAALGQDLTAATTAVGKVAATVVTDLSSAAGLYATLKGIGQVALAGLSIANPAAAALINSAIALADPVLTRVAASVSSASSTAATDAATLLAAATQISTAVEGTFTAVANATKS